MIEKRDQKLIKKSKLLKEFFAIEEEGKNNLEIASKAMDEVIKHHGRESGLYYIKCKEHTETFELMIKKLTKYAKKTLENDRVSEYLVMQETLLNYAMTGIKTIKDNTEKILS